ncbi:MAG: GerMN domain-containing protein [bacterium]|nr:GerMN domain-containing protein [bacterium]
MLKRHAIKKIIISTGTLLIFFLIYFFPNQNNFSIPEEVIYIDELTLPLYTIDQNNYVARTNIIKKENDDINYIINVLTKGSINSNYLPSNFYSPIPKGTKLIDYSLNDGLLKLNFSKELLNVTEEDEEKMIESLIYSLCELDNVKNIMIFVENEKLNELPNSKIKLPTTLDKSYGINKVYDIKNFKDTTKTTIYYLSKYENDFYYVPISKITNSDEKNYVEIIVNELKTSPIYENNLLSYLNASYELESYEILENSITLSFNNNLIASLEDKDLVEKVKYSISLSLRDTYNLDNIIINMN